MEKRDKLGGVTRIIFWQGCATRGLKPLPIYKDFFPSKTADLIFFWSKFSQIGTQRQWFEQLRIFFVKVLQAACVNLSVIKYYI